MALVVSAASGCSRGESPQQPSRTVAPPISARPMETPESTYTPPPEKSEAIRANTPKGAEEFTKYFLSIYNYAYATNDATPIRDVTLQGCRFCLGLIQEVARRHEERTRLEGGKVSAVDVVALPDSPADRTVVEATFAEAGSRLLRSDGTVVETFAPSEAQFMTIALRWDIVHGWRVIDAVVEDGPA